MWFDIILTYLSIKPKYRSGITKLCYTGSFTWRYAETKYGLLYLCHCLVHEDLCSLWYRAKWTYIIIYRSPFSYSAENKPDQIPSFRTSVFTEIKMVVCHQYLGNDCYTQGPCICLHYYFVYYIYIKIDASQITQNSCHARLYSAVTSASQCKLRRLRTNARLSALLYYVKLLAQKSLVRIENNSFMLIHIPCIFLFTYFYNVYLWIYLLEMFILLFYNK